MSPVDDGFMSGSMDKTVRLWDLRTPTCRGLLNVPSIPIVAYDVSGLVFAVAVNHYSRILLYDQSQFDRAPFLTITLEDPTLSFISYPPRAIYMTSLSFSSNGKYLLVGCSGDAHYIIDAFEGHVLAKLEGHVGLERRRMDAPLGIEPVKGNSGEEVSWTPDSKFVVGGSLDGKIFVWDVQNLQTRENQPINLQAHPERIKPLVILDGHPGPTRCVKFNPRFTMMCTAGQELVSPICSLMADNLTFFFLSSPGILATRFIGRRRGDSKRIIEEERYFSLRIVYNMYLATLCINFLSKLLSESVGDEFALNQAAQTWPANAHILLGIFYFTTLYLDRAGCISGLSSVVGFL
jgi:WD40 repeat protein